MLCGAPNNIFADQEMEEKFILYNFTEFRQNKIDFSRNFDVKILNIDVKECM